MDRHTTDDTTHAVQRLRKALGPGLPHAPSLIPLDILVTVTAAHREGAPDRQAAHQLTAMLYYRCALQPRSTHRGWMG